MMISYRQVAKMLAFISMGIPPLGNTIPQKMSREFNQNTPIKDVFSAVIAPPQPAPHTHLMFSCPSRVILGSFVLVE